MGLVRNLPQNVRDALWKRCKADRAFHAGLKAIE